MSINSLKVIVITSNVPSTEVIWTGRAGVVSGITVSVVSLLVALLNALATVTLNLAPLSLPLTSAME